MVPGTLRSAPGTVRSLPRGVYGRVPAQKGLADSVPLQAQRVRGRPATARAISDARVIVSHEPVRISGPSATAVAREVCALDSRAMLANDKVIDPLSPLTQRGFPAPAGRPLGPAAGPPRRRTGACRGLSLRGQCLWALGTSWCH